MTVSYYAPLPGARSGVADYSATLLTALRRTGTVETDGRAADIDLYQLGNNRLHEEIYAQALRRPGVAVLHDGVMHHFLLGTLSRDEYLAEWVYNYGEWRRDLGEDLWRGRARSAFDPRYFQFPMLRRIAGSARAVIVHNPGAAAMARDHGAVKVHVIPHFFEPGEPVDALDTARFRERIGVPPATTLFGLFGYLREPKRVLPTIKAFKKLHAARPATALLLAGEAVSGDLDRLLSFEAVHPGIRRLGHLSERAFRVAAAAVDCCVNLRYPAAGETSGIAIRLTGAGKPTILTDNEENSEFPRTAVLRVAHGVAEAEELFEHMVLVTEFPRIGREIGNVACLHISKHHAMETVARQYWEVLRGVCD
jgi:glycosyltransferase involved in cell wall biosynthesis